METFFRNERQAGVVKREFKRGCGDRAPAYEHKRGPQGGDKVSACVPETRENNSLPFKVCNVRARE